MFTAPDLRPVPPIARHGRPYRWAARGLALAATVLLFAARAAASPEIPAPPQAGPIVLVGATLHPVDGPDVPAGMLLFDGGRIVAMGREIAVPEGATRIELAGLHVYPGMIDAYTQLGLLEIPSLRASLDHTETGSVNPNAKAQRAFNPDSELIPVTRSGGVLTVVAAPTGGLIAGTSAVMQLDGWTYEDMALKADWGIHLAWPNMAPERGWWVEESDAEQLAKRDAQFQQLRRTFADARAYHVAWQAHLGGKGATPEFDARWEAMRPLLEREMPLVVSANDARQIRGAMAFAQAEGLRLVIYGGYDAPDCADLLKQHNVPVILAAVHRLPRNDDSPVDEPFTIPARLHKAGVRFCISESDATANVRNLPHHAGAAAAAGLPVDVALRSITLSPAEILEVADRIGSLAVGKDATLIVTDGDLLEVTTRVQQAYIAGRRIDLSDRQKRLYEKYQEKYRRLEKAAPK
jgi:imidazolonepropionase-like amidohydrolase